MWVNEKGLQGQVAPSREDRRDGPGPRSCIFCGARPVTREHVWPDWLRHTVTDEEAMEHTGVLELRGRVTELFRYDDRPYKATANVVCVGCNNGWMGRGEEAAKSYLGGMVAGRGRELHQGGQAELARWALLKAIVFDYAAPKEGRSVNPELTAFLFRHREPPSQGCRVWLGAYGGDMPGFTAMTALAVGTEEQSYTGERNVWVRTIGVGPVVFQIFSTSVLGLADYDPGWGTLPNPPQVIPIWPTGTSVRWLPSPSLNDAGLLWFSDHIVSSMIRSSGEYRP
jgi:hypothetical protein